MRVAPLLLIAVGLIVVFKAGIWNLGMDGQFLLAAAVIAGIGPRLEHHLPNAINLSSSSSSPAPSALRGRSRPRC